MAVPIIIGALLFAGFAYGWVVVTRRRFIAHLDGIELSIRKNGGPTVPRSDLPVEVLALAQRMGARSDIAPSFAEFEQSGVMWLSQGAKATKFNAHQTVGVSKSAFMWRAAMGPAGVILVADYFVDGTGGLEATLLGVVSLAKSVGGAGANQGEILRYLAELPWNPDAILMNVSLDWTVIDPQTIAVAAGTGENRGEITFNLDANGLVERASAPSRLYVDKGRTTALPWHGRFWDYQNVSGKRIPLQGEVAWAINGRDFVYWRGSVSAIR